MKVDYSKAFSKAVKKLSGKVLQSVIKMIDEVKSAPSIDAITDCKKLEAFNSVYRIRVGNRRAFFTLHVVVTGELVVFQYIFSRGEAYDKKNMEKLRNCDGIC